MLLSCRMLQSSAFYWVFNWGTKSSYWLLVSQSVVGHHNSFQKIILIQGFMLGCGYLFQFSHIDHWGEAQNVQTFKTQNMPKIRQELFAFESGPGAFPTIARPTIKIRLPGSQKVRYLFVGFPKLIPILDSSSWPEMARNQFQTTESSWLSSLLIFHCIDSRQRRYWGIL